MGAAWQVSSTRLAVAGAGASARQQPSAQTPESTCTTASKAHCLEMQGGQADARCQGDGDAVLPQRRRVLGDGPHVRQRDGVHLQARLGRVEQSRWRQPAGGRF